MTAEERQQYLAKQQEIKRKAVEKYETSVLNRKIVSINGDNYGYQILLDNGTVLDFSKYGERTSSVRVEFHIKYKE